MCICPWIPDRASRVRNDTVVRLSNRVKDKAAMTTALNIGDLVEKHTGDYRAEGEVRSVFTLSKSAVPTSSSTPPKAGGHSVTSIPD
jgi:hypothetical protein